MGNNLEAIPNKLRAAYNPSMEDWEIKQKTDKVKLWQNKNTGEFLEEFSYVATDKAQLYRLRAHFEHRFNKPYIVASKFFRERQTDELCSSFYETSMFIEFIGLRLSQFRDVTFPDCLHLYNACLHGFGQLQARLGFFDVSDSLVGLNQSGQVKVWANPDFSKQRPRITASKEGEAQMLKEVIDLVDSNIDIQSQPQSISLYLKQNAKSFQQAVAALRQYAAKHQVEIPSCLETVNHLRQHGMLDAGPFIRSAPLVPVVNNKPQPLPAPPIDSKHPISLLQAQAARYPVPRQKSPTAFIAPNPHITSVMYQPIEVGRNLIAPPFPRQNIIINTNNMKSSEQLSSIYFHNVQNKSNNIKQSQIISQLVPGMPSEEETPLINDFKKHPAEQRPIYSSTPTFSQREEGVSNTAENIATLNKKYFNISPPSFSPEHRQSPFVTSISPPAQPSPQPSISHLARNLHKRNPPIFTSLQGSNRRPNFKGSEPQIHGNELFNNTIIYSIQNQVRRDQMQAAYRLEAKRNKLRLFHPLKLTIHRGDVVEPLERQCSESNLKQSANHVFSITINNKPEYSQYQEPQNGPVRVFSDEAPEPREPIPQTHPQRHKIHKVHYSREEEEPIRYIENQGFDHLGSFSEQRNQQTYPQRYNYANYSFDKNYQFPVSGSMEKDRAEVGPQKEQVEPQKPVQQPPVPLSQSPVHSPSQVTTIVQKQQIRVVEIQQPTRNVSPNNSLLLKASLKNPHKVQSGMRLFVAPVGSSPSDIISSIQEIRNSERQLREELKQFI